jgi:hypothetical protein
LTKRLLFLFLLLFLLGGLADWYLSGDEDDESGADEARANLRQAQDALARANIELAGAKQTAVDLEAENSRLRAITAEIQSAYSELERLHQQDRVGDDESAGLIDEGAAILKRARESEQEAKGPKKNFCYISLAPPLFMRP